MKTHLAIEVRGLFLRGRGGRELLAQCGDQRIGGADHPLLGVPRTGENQVTAVHHQRRHRVDLRSLREVDRALEPAFDRERLERRVELGDVDLLPAEPIRELPLVGDPQPVLVDRVEQGLMQAIELADRVQRVVHAPGHRPTLVEHRRHAPELDVLRQLLDPGLEERLERVAMGALVPEELDHLDLALGVGRDRRIDLEVGADRLGGGGRGRDRGREGRRRNSEQGSDHFGSGSGQFLSRTSDASTPFCASVERTRFISSSWLYGPRRTRYQVPRSGRVAGSTLETSPSSASLALRLSASAGFWNAPAWTKYTSLAAPAFSGAFAAARRSRSVTGSSWPGRIL